jgi:hypothetical protein
MATDDEEIAAMGAVSKALEPLSPAVRSRVLSWASARYDVNVPKPAGTATNETPSDLSQRGRFADVANIFYVANPTTNGDKVLVVSYWLQEIDGLKDLDSQRVNANLKQLGHGIANITSAFTELMTSKPKFAIQVRKAGSSKQARKRYRITAEGIKRVEELVAGANT